MRRNSLSAVLFVESVKFETTTLLFTILIMSTVFVGMYITEIMTLSTS